MLIEQFDAVTRREIEHFINRKENEFDKIGGQIARDLRRLGGDYAFRDAANYRTLEQKYRRSWASKKKLAILEMMKEKWARAEVEE